MAIKRPLFVVVIVEYSVYTLKCFVQMPIQVDLKLLLLLYGC